MRPVLCGKAHLSVRLFASVKPPMLQRVRSDFTLTGLTYESNEMQATSLTDNRDKFLSVIRPQLRIDEHLPQTTFRVLNCELVAIWLVALPEYGRTNALFGVR